MDIHEINSGYFSKTADKVTSEVIVGKNNIHHSDRAMKPRVLIVENSRALINLLREFN